MEGTLLQFLADIMKRSKPFLSHFVLYWDNTMIQENPRLHAQFQPTSVYGLPAVTLSKQTAVCFFGNFDNFAYSSIVYLALNSSN